MQNKEFSFEIKTGSIEEAVTLSRQIPELADPHDAEEYKKRLNTTPHLILIAYDGKLAIGFKVAYERKDHLLKGATYFYSWMGGVLPAYRRKGIGQLLAGRQEEWARQQKYPHITFKTRNRHKAMLLFGISNGFQIIGFEAKDEVGEHRVILRKYF